DRPVTWRGFGADMPVVRGTGSKAKTSPVLYAAADHVRLARLQIDGAFNSASAVQVQATGVWLVGLQIYGFGQHGIGVGNVPDTFIAGNLIRDGGTRPNLDHGIWVTGQGARIRDNVVTDLPNGYGIFLQYQTQSSARVFANVVRNVAGGGIGLSRVKGGNHIYNNIVWSVGTSQGCRCAVEVAYGKLGGEPSTEDRVYFNTFLGPGFTGLFLADRDGSVQLHGNVFADFRVGIRVDDEVSTAALASSHNLWYRADEPPQFKWAGPWLDYTQFQNESDQERPSLLADPKLVDPAAGDAHLAPGSPAAGGTAGTAGAGGASGSGGGAGGTGPDGGARDNPAPNDDDGRGCGCSVPGGNGGSGVGWGLTLAAVAGTWRRRRSVP
ncbi:MAG: right-handed parallel beta-helix repeat-containing protein, partial [Polyangiaceae bacterium]|nr:right-handed parallel beta-helix repeat-containing protein [Polyangiaceae bacterium]